MTVIGVMPGCSNPNDPHHNDFLCANSKVIDSAYVIPYGVFNEELRNDKIVYQVCPASVIVSIIFSETIIAPVYLIGWELWEPVKKR